MQVNVGDIVEGKVTGLTNFGAFVKLTTGEVGMVHISEVATSYVKDIKDYLAEGQDVKVKVLAINDAGKISLSIKQTEPKPESQSSRSGDADRRDRNKNPKPKRGGAQVWQGSKKDDKPQSFEDMMAKFKQTSDERQSGLKKTSDSRRGSYHQRGGGSNKH